MHVLFKLQFARFRQDRINLLAKDEVVLLLNLVALGLAVDTIGTQCLRLLDHFFL